MREDKYERPLSSKRIKRILKLPSQNFMTVEYVSGETEIIERS